MLSFFYKKKQGSDTPPEEAIQGPSDPAQVREGGDDFIFIERKTTDNDPTRPPVQAMGIYPPMPSTFVKGGYSGHPVYPPVGNAGDGNAAPMPYVQGVPFQLASHLNTKSDFEVIQLQVDSILALLTRQMSVDESEEYTFALERSIKSECY